MSVAAFMSDLVEKLFLLCLDGAHCPSELVICVVRHIPELSFFSMVSVVHQNS